MVQKDNETKKKILTLALKLIKEQGYDNVTLNDICTASDISKHTFYYYFHSKDDILREFYTIPREISTSMLTSILAAESNIEQFWLLLEPVIDFIVETGPEIMKRIFIANLTQDIGTFDESKANPDLPQAEMAIIKKAQEVGEIRNQSEPLDLMRTNFMQVMGNALLWCSLNGGFDLHNTVRNSMETLFDMAPQLRKANRGKLFIHKRIQAST
jgi:AcrR family transcriptional regulator